LKLNYDCDDHDCDDHDCDVGLSECSGSSLVCHFAVKHSSGYSPPLPVLYTTTTAIAMRPRKKHDINHKKNNRKDHGQ